MKRFASDTLYASTEWISTWDVSPDYIEQGEFSRVYTDEPQYQQKIDWIAEAMTGGQWLHAMDFLKANPWPLAWSTVPLVFLRDGTLYEGKHRLTAMSRLDAFHAFQFVVIRGWNDGLPMPDGWLYNWQCGPDHTWWLFREYLYQAVRAVKENDGAPTLLDELYAGILVQENGRYDTGT